MQYLLDTAPWVNGVTLPETIPPTIRRLLESQERTGLCRISLLETAILHRLGGFAIEGSLADFYAAGLSQDVQLLDLTPDIAVKTNDLSTTFQGDPFDRTIVATAFILNLTLITTDLAIRNARSCKVEYYRFRPLRARSAGSKTLDRTR
jgi:PIN domain nuclease of toxin-antitoxin system